MKTPLSHLRYLYDLGQTERNSVSPSCLKRDLVADTWIKMIRGSKCRGWTKGKGGTEPEEKSPAASRTSRTDEHQACKLTCGQGEHGRSVQQREQNRADNPGGSHVSLARLLFVSVLFPRVALFLLLLLPRCCRLFDPGAKLRTARRGRGGGKETARVQPECCASCLFLFPLSSNETSLKARWRKV